MEIALLVLGAVIVWAVTKDFSRKPSNRLRVAHKPVKTASKQSGSPRVVGQPEPFDPTSSHPAPKKTTLEGKAYVVDGDTLKIKGKQIRLFGIDAPEIDHPYGRIAKSAMRKLCGGKIVTAEIVAEDDHGRAVARCSLQDGRDLSAELVKQGLAIDWEKYSGGEYRSMEQPGVRKKKLFLADQRQRGNMKAWRDYETWRQNQSAKE